MAIRNVRREANEALHQLENDKTLGVDERKKAQDGIQKLTDNYVGKVENVLLAKENEILSI